MFVKAESYAPPAARWRRWKGWRWIDAVVDEPSQSG
jgi:hypothetical protein